MDDGGQRGGAAGVGWRVWAWLASSLAAALSAALDALFPCGCTVCGSGRAALCPSCWRRLRPAPWLPPPAHVDRCASLLAYDGPARTILVRLKYRNQRGVLAWLASAMADLARPAVEEAGVVSVTWAPTSSVRRRARGYDQAELLARGVARQLGLPCRKHLTRAPGPPQTGRSRLERHQGPAFVPTGRAPPPTVLLVDDVITTGATASAAASALRSGGARSVVVVAAARTALKNSALSVDP